MKTSLHVNLNKRWRVKWPGIEARIRQHYPYSEPGAGVTWIALDALAAFADLLDAEAAALAEIARSRESTGMEEDNHDDK